MDVKEILAAQGVSNGVSTKPRLVRVAATQMACSWNRDENVRNAEALVRQAAKAGANIILLQELFEAWYFCQWQIGEFFSFAKPNSVHENPLLDHFSKLAAELQVVLPISFFERHNNAHYNSLIVFDADGSPVGLYRKSHIPDGPGYQEKFYFNPGDTGFQVFHTRYATIGVAICWDQWFPEAARCMALMGAEVLFYPTAIGSEPQDASLDSRAHWETVMRGHAGANLVPLVASNRIGVEKDITFYGGSFIANHTGQLIAKASEQKMEVITAEFDLAAIRAARSSWGLFRDRRPELYGLISSLDGSHRSAAVAQHPPTIPAAVSCRTNKQPIAPAATLAQQTWTLALTPSPLLSSSPDSVTPAAQGFRMPAEWESHSATWMIWPIRPDNWRDQAVPAQAAFTEVATAISQFEPVVMCVDPKYYAEARGRLPPTVKVVEMSYDDAWMRDSGPSFIVNDATGEVRGIDWDFNAWGGGTEGCYFPYDNDILVARKVIELAGAGRYKCPIVMEGGSFHVDGEGTLITTEECLLNKNRNPQLSKQDIEGFLKQYLHVQKIIWLPLGVYGDEDTNGHVDNLCCFIRPGEVVLTWTDDVKDPQYHSSKRALDILSQTKDAKGRSIRVHKIPSPPPLFMTDEDVRTLEVASDKKEKHELTRHPGKHMAASYVNFYIANGCVVMPSFNVPQDEQAQSVLQSLFPDREVLRIKSSRDILLGGGNIHCITQQQPAAPKRR